MDKVPAKIKYVATTRAAGGISMPKNAGLASA